MIVRILRQIVLVAIFVIFGVVWSKESMSNLERHKITSDDSIGVCVIQSFMNEEDIETIWIGFYTETGGKYTAVHVLKREGNISVPYILLSSPDHNRKEFRKVAKIITTLAEGKTEKKEITDREDDICQVIFLPKDINKKQINNLFKQYAEYFYSLRMEKRFTADN